MTPNAQRTIWPTDIDIGFIGKHFLKKYHFKKRDEKKIEANNLVIDSSNKKELSDCLKKNLAINSFLTEDEILWSVYLCELDYQIPLCQLFTMIYMEFFHLFYINIYHSCNRF